MARQASLATEAATAPPDGEPASAPPAPAAPADSEAPPASFTAPAAPTVPAPEPAPPAALPEAVELALLAQAERALFGPPKLRLPGAMGIPAPPVPPRAAVPPPHRGSAAESAADAAAGDVMEVTIGRLEVVAPPPPVPPRRRSPRPHTTLQSYLDRRRAGVP